MTSLLDLNNEAVELLRQKKVAGAIEGFHRIIHQARAAMLHCEQHKSNNSDASFRNQAYQKYSIKGMSLHGLSRLPSTSPHNVVAVYERAFAFDRTFDPIANQVLFNAVVFFNLALAYHRMALTEIKDSDLNMKQALSWYRRGLNAVRENRTASPASDQLFLLALAFLNNMGHVLWHFFRVKDAIACRDSLDVLLESPIPVTLCEQDAEFFYLGKFHQRLCCTVAVAPAA